MNRPAAVFALLLLGFACRKESGWTCRQLGRSTACVETQATSAPPAPWSCHEWRGHQLCFAPGGTSSPDASWRCRRDGPRSLCLRAGFALPASTVPSDGWRCVRGRDGRRTCRSRGWGNAPWQCDAGTCRRLYPDFPNQWDWECFGQQGHVVCRCDTPAPADPGWTCKKLGEQLLCVDPDPDFPEDAVSGWSCRLQNAESTEVRERFCQKASDPTPCKTDEQCRGGFCLQNRCVLAVLAADCFFDKDCPPGTPCLGGACLGQ